MTIAEMLSQSGVLTLLGMAVVFAFLVIMIFAMMLMHSIIHALKWDAEKKDETETHAVSPQAADAGAVAAAVAVALKEKNAL